MQRYPIAGQIYIGLVIAAGVAILSGSIMRWEHPSSLPKFVCYLAVAAAVSALKVRLPGVTGTLSVSYVFILIGMTELALAECLLMGCVATVIQSYWHVKERPTSVRLLFNGAGFTIAIAVSYSVYHSGLDTVLANNVGLVMVTTACAYFFTNTVTVAFVIGLTEGKSPLRVWRECYFCTFLYYLAGALIATLSTVVNHYLGWITSLLAVPAVYVVYRSYQLYLYRLEAEKKHAEDMAALHLRTIEALALAIEAKDEKTHEHLERVQVYALEIGKEMGLNEQELRALHAAAILHDIGKLAVPEHILCKPGKLTPEEFEKLKVHPTVGAQILERIDFPYPVVPIVAAHHEKWDGTGYPLGLQGEEIPLAARILAAVDCLDALTSDRQYRRALPLEEAMRVVVSESGKSYDPRVVQILQRRYRELEEMVRRRQGSRRNTPAWGSTARRAAAPAAGYERARSRLEINDGRDGALDFLSSIAAARHEAHALLELSQALGSSISLTETLGVLDSRLRRMICYDTIVVWLVAGERLIPKYVHGQDIELFASLEVPLGEGLSGWVAQTAKPIVNGNPSVEPGYLSDPNKFSTMRSALAIPLEGVNGVLGVLSLYRRESDAFSREDLRILLAVSSKVSAAIDNALRYRQVEMSATTDALTGLPNARALFLRLENELGRCRRSGESLTVFVCDLDGFKQVNDRMGHLVGNRVLRRVASGFRQSCRPYDYVARMGGDEFVMVFPGFKPEDVRDRIFRLKEIVEDAGREICGEEIISLSVGLAAYPSHGDDAEKLLAEADREMYRAKHRNRITAFDWEPGLEALSKATARQALQQSKLNGTGTATKESSKSESLVSAQRWTPGPGS